MVEGFYHICCWKCRTLGTCIYIKTQSAFNLVKYDFLVDYLCRVTVGNRRVGEINAGER